MLDIWVKLDSGELVDKAFPGSELIYNMLMKLQDPELVFKFSEPMLKKDPILGVKVRAFLLD